MKIKKFFSIVFVVLLLGVGALSLTEMISAQTWQLLWSGDTGVPGCSGTYDCPPTFGSCATLGATLVNTTCGCDASVEYMSGTYTCAY